MFEYRIHWKKNIRKIKFIYYKKNGSNIQERMHKSKIQ